MSEKRRCANASIKVFSTRSKKTQKAVGRLGRWYRLNHLIKMIQQGRNQTDTFTSSREKRKQRHSGIDQPYLRNCLLLLLSCHNTSFAEFSHCRKHWGTHTNRILMSIYSGIFRTSEINIAALIAQDSNKSSLQEMLIMFVLPSYSSIRALQDATN
ncbi:hypothetical protein NEOLI_003527 [Neolecta irregularis DAH-3]|uniref:Uncharacterized protein n=1 Tax=Neolecta irregularis (strain DAH-3) TaxID=1198029 RepID=A0A1U7LKB2_NEOID|nr:hypothetical protein NEOLI_003527 [Neolecta irregularis DAH-3]|eukprot:OLL22961.1 hypothetical protein NEOLI_003527 [Neolecta irregularis DAH-3]